MIMKYIILIKLDKIAKKKNNNNEITIKKLSRATRGFTTSCK